MKTELNFLPDEDGKEITIREGKALEIKEPVKITFTGDITAVANYLKGRNTKAISVDVARFSADDNYQPVYSNLSIVTVDKEAQTIKLEVSPNEAYGTTITAQLKDSEEIKAFFINEQKMFDRQELVKLLRFSKRFFADGDAHQGLIEKLQKLAVSSSINSNTASDERGNKNLSLDKKVNTDLPAGFFLMLPIFKNQPAVKFWVDLSLDSSEGTTRFWLESVELEEIREKLIDEIFAEQLISCEGLVIINK